MNKCGCCLNGEVFYGTHHRVDLLTLLVPPFFVSLSPMSHSLSLDLALCFHSGHLGHCGILFICLANVL
jgi:hypothetical protein